jgi:hypothetical protein
MDVELAEIQLIPFLWASTLATSRIDPDLHNFIEPSLEQDNRQSSGDGAKTRPVIQLAWALLLVYTSSGLDRSHFFRQQSREPENNVDPDSTRDSIPS